MNTNKSQQNMRPYNYKWEDYMSRRMKVNGTYWRVPSGYKHTEGTTAMDVFIFDREELMNTDTHWFKQSISLDEIPANECAWFCAEEEKAKIYTLKKPSGEVLVVPQAFILENAILLGTDGMYGFFIYTPHKEIQS